MRTDTARQTGISSQAEIVVVVDQVSTELEDEAVILNLKDGVYYGLDPVGTRIWNLLQQPRRFGAILDILLEEYDVAPERCEQDLLRLLRELVARGLIMIKDAPTA